MNGLRAGQAQGRRGGRPAAVSDDVLAVARARRERGEPVTAIARHLRVGRSTLHRALDLEHGAAAWQPMGGVPATAPRVPEPGIGGQQSGPGERAAAGPDGEPLHSV
jgi:hypothetical protein